MSDPAVRIPRRSAGVTTVLVISRWMSAYRRGYSFRYYCHPNNVNWDYSLSVHHHTILMVGQNKK